MKYFRLNNNLIFNILFISVIITGILAFVFSTEITQLIYGKCYSGSDKIEVLKFIAQFIGGSAIVLGLFISNWRAKSIEYNLKITEDGNITERFNQAITNLASSDISIKLGGIYALHRIAIKSAYDRSSIFEIFCSYIRQKNPKSQNTIKSIEYDSQVILNLLFKNEENIYKNLKADLTGIVLNGTDLSNSKLIFVDFSNSILTNTKFQNSYFLQTKFIETDLTGSVFDEAIFSHTYFNDALVDNCSFYEAKFKNFDYFTPHLSIDQLSKTKTLLDCEGIPDEIVKELKKEFPDLFD